MRCTMRWWALAVVMASANALVMRITDAVSQRTVVLVGTMHYNPRSVELAATAVRNAAEERAGLHAVAIELCSDRWCSEIAAQWSRTPSLDRMLSEDEFQVAFETATDVRPDPRTPSPLH